MFAPIRLLKAVLIVALAQAGFVGAANETADPAAPPKRSQFQQLADKAANGGWEALRAGRIDDAQYRFRQALTFDKSNGLALWGLAVAHAKKGEYRESLEKFELAEKTVSNEVNFQVDLSRTLGYAGVAANNQEMIQAALDKFGKIYQEYPQHGANLQNWAIILYYTGNYSQAWEKVALAEKVAAEGVIDPRFLAELQAKMPRP